MDCGIDVRTGKSLVTAGGIDEDSLYVKADNASSLLSWLIPIGLFPVASDAYGHKKPYAIWTIAALTTLVSIVYFLMGGLSENASPQLQNLMLWSGSISGEQIDAAYGEMGPIVAWVDHAHHLNHGENRFLRQNDGQVEIVPGGSDADLTREEAEAESDKMAVDYAEQKDQLYGTVPDQDLSLAAYHALPDSEQVFHYQSFHWYQTITNIFLHGGIMHLAGNMVFLLVFGSRVNALLGQIKTTILYFLLGVVASMSHYYSQQSQPIPTPALGASGAIMGLAGMYFVLFPVSRVYMIFWIRFGLFTGFRRYMKIWAPRGFWVLLFYLAFDVFATVFGAHDGTAHWAHLGGFIGGMVIAFALLFGRLVNTGGGDILSAMLGRRAWALIGKPTDRPGAAVMAVPTVRGIDISYR